MANKSGRHWIIDMISPKSDLRFNYDYFPIIGYALIKHEED